MLAGKQLREIARDAHVSRKSPLDEDIRKAAFSQASEERSSAVGNLRGNLPALITLIMRTNYADTAAEAIRAFGESLDAQNAAIVSKCVAIFSDDPKRREAALLSLKGNRDEIREVMADSRYQDTRAMARSMLLA